MLLPTPFLFVQFYSPVTTAQSYCLYPTVRQNKCFGILELQYISTVYYILTNLILFLIHTNSCIHFRVFERCSSICLTSSSPKHKDLLPLWHTVQIFLNFQTSPAAILFHFLHFLYSHQCYFFCPIYGSFPCNIITHNLVTKIKKSFILYSHVSSAFCITGKTLIIYPMQFNICFIRCHRNDIRRCAKDFAVTLELFLTSQLLADRSNSFRHDGAPRRFPSEMTTLLNRPRGGPLSGLTKLQFWCPSTLPCGALWKVRFTFRQCP
jgi:hypothetical protein